MSITAREIIKGLAYGSSAQNDAEIEEVVDGVFADLDRAGFAIVPKEPTAQMIEAGDDTDHTIEAMSEHPDYEEQIANIYRAMIAAALKPPTMIAEG